VERRAEHASYLDGECRSSDVSLYRDQVLTKIVDAALSGTELARLRGRRLAPCCTS